MGKRKRYDDKFRANAVLLLEAAGYPDKIGALTQVSNNLKVPKRTLSRWYNKEQNPPPDNLVTEKKAELKDLLKREIEGALGDMPNARQDASYRDLGTVTGILIDKLQLLTGKPTEIVDDSGLTDDDRANRIAAILDRARTRRDRQHTGDD
jgi:transposase-like protein